MAKIHSGRIDPQRLAWFFKTLIFFLISVFWKISFWLLAKFLESPKKQAKKEAEVLLKKVGLLDKIDEYPKRLSGGQQQRIAIVRALAMHPKILLFDEPVSALDPEMIEDIVKIIQELSREITIIIVTHEISFAKNISHRMIFMDGGKILADDAPDEVINQTANPRIQAFFH